MAAKADLGSPVSTALVPYTPPSARTELETATDLVARKSLRTAQYEIQNLDPRSETTRKAWPRKITSVLPMQAGPSRVEKSHFLVEIPPHAGKFKDDRIGVDVYTPAGGTGDRPVLLFSHGWETRASEYRPLLENIASHGFLVVSLNHPSSAEKFPAPLTKDEEPEVVRELGETQAHNIECAVNLLRGSGLIGETPIVLGGHSMGGAASITVAREDAMIAGCINLDGAVSQTEAVGKPVLTLLADHLQPIDSSNREDREWVEKEYVPMFQNWVSFGANSHAAPLQIPGSKHTDFSISPEDNTPRIRLRALEASCSEVVKFLAHLT